jgi:hypothetical protein
MAQHNAHLIISCGVLLVDLSLILYMQICPAKQSAFTKNQLSTVLHLAPLHVLCLLASSSFYTSFQATEHGAVLTPADNSIEK